MQHAASKWRRLKARLHNQLERFGERDLLQRLGVSRQSLYRFLAGLPVRRGTSMLLERVETNKEIDVDGDAHGQRRKPD